MNKILTIVIPTYNMALLLPRCLDSLVNPKQSDKLEVLVINDGSKDDSLSVAKKYESKYPNIIKVIDKDNNNYGSCVNEGIYLASGKYFRILDSDDFYDNSGLLKLIDKLESIDVDMVLTDFRRDRGIESVFYKSPSILYNKIMEMKDVDLRRFPNYAMHGITYKTSILRNNDIRLQTGISYTDSEYCFYPIPFVQTLIALDILVYCYQLGREGQTVDIKSQLKSLNSMTQIINRMYETLKELDSKSTFFTNQIIMFCNINALCFMTILCFDKSNSNLDLLKNLEHKINNIDGVSDTMMKANLFGIHYYRRFVKKRKNSSSLFLSSYYKAVKLLVHIYHWIKVKFKITLRN